MLFVDGGTDQVGVEISSFTSTGGAGTKLEVGGSIVVKKDQGHLYVYSNDYVIGKIGNSGSGANLDTGYFSLSREAHSPPALTKRFHIRSQPDLPVYDEGQVIRQPFDIR